jgi:hypothetical protein
MWFMQNAIAKPENAGAGSYDYMHLFGLVALGYMWAQIAKAAIANKAAGNGDAAAMEAKLITGKWSNFTFKVSVRDMGRIEKTVFISYRRTNASWALAIYQYLNHHGYDAFIDFEGIASGGFERVILENIRARAHFLVLLTPSALEDCSDPKDWLKSNRLNQAKG